MRLRVYAPMAAASVLVLLAIHGTAVAKGCHHTVTPQGNSEAEQYSETLPGPCGNQPANPGGSGGGSHSSSIPPSTLNQLNSQGAAGQHAAALAQAVSPPGSAGKGSNGAGRSGNQSGGGNQSNGGGNAGSGITNALAGNSGGSGIGLLLPLILAGTLVAGITYWVMRRRRAGPVS